ncbi:hypothetical protein [Aquibium oceanicum]|uniref:NUDIX hydrolase n=1 Tax=Aquibium oceanicum TaxID=1670800 RepID=A0A1L3STG8_9HYPH|nr:hypothetical protein [Aquibium oceanicum]APH72684.1 hypothetical protein BSQ44_15945 [Aquibium oceanicum]
MAFTLAMNRLVDVADARLRVDPAPHPYEARNAAAIEANWQRETAANPHLFDGRVLVFSRLETTRGRFEGEAHAARFATFMHWRKESDKQDMRHVFANAVLVTTDGALVAIEMGAHTVSAGKVYFPSGSFEPDDVADGEIDIVGNMRREVAEETGLSIDGLPHEPGYRVLALDTGTVLTTRFRLPMSAGEAEERIRAHMATEEQPEIARPVIIRDAALAGINVAGHMPQLVDWHFANPLKDADLIA